MVYVNVAEEGAASVRWRLIAATVVAPVAPVDVVRAAVGVAIGAGVGAFSRGATANSIILETLTTGIISITVTITCFNNSAYLALFFSYSSQVKACSNWLTFNSDTSGWGTGAKVGNGMSSSAETDELVGAYVGLDG